ncbi:hypothetical protein C8R45DRAFT_927276 [Mycena sanguinolenta]|nr:hypothetical protein C8R45DRAFT_927276 [Mycena sanguinolenta]
MFLALPWFFLWHKLLVSRKAHRDQQRTQSQPAALGYVRYGKAQSRHIVLRTVATLFQEYFRLPAQAALNGGDTSAAVPWELYLLPFRASIVTAIVQHLIHQILKFFIEGGHGINFTLASATAYKKPTPLSSSPSSTFPPPHSYTIEAVKGRQSPSSPATPSPRFRTASAGVPGDATATDAVRAGAEFSRSSDRSGVYETITIEYDSGLYNKY